MTVAWIELGVLAWLAMMRQTTTRLPHSQILAFPHVRVIILSLLHFDTWYFLVFLFYNEKIKKINVTCREVCAEELAWSGLKNASVCVSCFCKHMDDMNAVTVPHLQAHPPSLPPLAPRSLSCIFVTIHTVLALVVFPCLSPSLPSIQPPPRSFPSTSPHPRHKAQPWPFQ